MELKSPDIIRILHLEDLPSDADLVERNLKDGKVTFEKLVVDNKSDFEKALTGFIPDIILSDHSLPGFDSIQALKIVKDKGLKIPFILVTATVSEEFAADVMKQGACDYILKDRLQRLPVAVMNAIEKNYAEKSVEKFIELTIQNERRFRTLIERSIDMIALSTPAGELIYGSPSITVVLGYSLEEYLNKSAADFIHPDDLPGFEESRRQILQLPGKSYHHQQRLRHKSGNWIWCEGTVSNLLYEPGIHAFVSNFRDITERKLAEERSLQSEARLNEAQKLSHIANWEIDLLTNVNTWSDEFYNIIGGKKENVEATAESFVSSLHPDDIAYARARVAKAFEFFEDSYFYSRIINKDGSIKYIYSEWKFEFDRNKKPIRLFGILVDITERRMAEMELEHQNTELVKVNGELDRFVYSASHELRAPLMSVLGLINLSKLDSNDIDQLHKLKLMENSIKNLDIFIQDIVHYSRNSRLGIEQDKIDFKQLVSESIEHLRYMEQASRTNISVNVSEEIDFYSDRKRMRVILNNILSNAIKYQNLDNPNPEIEIEIRTFTDRVDIRISDNGIGIEAEYQDRIFNMFFRASEKRTGSGLGLFIVKEIIEKLQGTIEVSSEEGKGTTFSLTVKNMINPDE
jgi:PAS domain S-box-containing protein